MSESRHEPTGKTRLPLLPGVDGGAYITADGRYRLYLWRSWDGVRETPPKRYWLFIGLNPSTAEAYVDDPTIRKEIAFTRRHGGLGYYKCNIMDYRATDPVELLKLPVEDPCSIFNIPSTLKMVKEADRVIVAWGNVDKRFQIHADKMLDMLKANHIDLWCFGTNQNGSPKHTCRLGYDTPLIPFSQ